MRTHPAIWAPIVSFAVLAGCSNGAAPPSADAGRTGSSGSSGSVGSSGSGASSNSSPAGPFSYTPKGCSYTVTPSSLVAYTATALDDNSSAGPASTATPTRVRLGLGGDTTAGQPGYADPTTTAAFTWETAGANTAAKLRYATSSGAVSGGTVQSGYVWTLAATSVSSASYMHEVHVCGLTPATTYYYQVGGGAPGAEIWSATQSFTTLPTSGAITVGIYGDARDSQTVWQLANEHMKALSVSALLFTGDLVYFGGEESEFNTWLDAIWQDPNNAGQFLTLGELMFLPVAGNHEYITDTNAAHFSSAFAIPGTGTYAKTFGSYDIGIAHFVYVDDTQIGDTTAGMDSPEADAQVAWLKADLAAADADRANHAFIFVLNHRGLYSTSMHASDSDVLQARTTLAPIFAEYKVDGVFNGHDHEYERTNPIVPGSPVTGDPVMPAAGAAFKGTTYVICAGVGATSYPVGQGTQAWRATKVAFGSVATGVNATYQGVYQTLKLDPTSKTAVITAYALTGAMDPMIDTYTFNAQ